MWMYSRGSLVSSWVRLCGIWRWTEASGKQSWFNLAHCRWLFCHGWIWTSTPSAPCLLLLVSLTHAANLFRLAPELWPPITPPVLFLFPLYNSSPLAWRYALWPLTSNCPAYDGPSMKEKIKNFFIFTTLFGGEKIKNGRENNSFFYFLFHTWSIVPACIVLIPTVQTLTSRLSIRKSVFQLVYHPMRLNRWKSD